VRPEHVSAHGPKHVAAIII